MGSQNKSLKLSGALVEIAETLAARNGYPSWNAYVKGLMRFDALVQKEHTLTLPWAKTSDDEQGRIDEYLLSLVRSGEGVKGQYLENKIREIAQECSADPEVVKSKLKGAKK